MGAWGGKLYDSDFACDMRADIAGYMRAPISDEEVLAKIEQAHGLGHDGEHVDGFDYWLVLADQLERRGMPNPDIFERAIGIIERGEDVRALEKLNAGPKTLAARRKDTAKILGRLRNPRPAKKRRPVKAPQPFLFEVGEMIVWPTDRGNAFGPFLPDCRFEPDGWGCAIINGRGRDYDVFPYYIAQALMWRRSDRPRLEDAAHCRRSSNYRTSFTPRDIQEQRIERLGLVDADVLGTPPEPQKIYRHGLSLGIDGFHRFAIGFLKFPYPAQPGPPHDADEPDQRPGHAEWLNDKAGQDAAQIGTASATTG